MRSWTAAGLLMCGCAAHFPLPMTSAKLAEYDSGPALVAYLAQPDASPIVCDLRARGPHISRPTPDILDALVDGLGSGKTDPTLWRRCIDVLLKGLPRDQAQPLFDELARVYRKALRGSDIEQSPAVAERLAMIHRLFLERPAGLDGSASVVQPLLE